MNISPDQLQALGITAPELAQMTSRGYLPPAGPDGWPMVHAIKAAIRFARETAATAAVFDSMTACARGTGIPLTKLKTFKSAGCPAFQHGRVNMALLLKWAFTSGDAQEAIDIAYERARAQRLQADLLAMDKDERAKDTIRLAEAQELIRDALAPVRQRLIALPAEMAHRTNPADPAFARRALEDWRRECLAYCQAQTSNCPPPPAA